MNLKRLFFGVLACVASVGLSAQDFSQMPQLDLDPAVRKGVLPNGLTYYVRHNNWPENRAYFYIAQKVGSMQEDESQRGLAHFLEHMCFNGTTHYPGNKLKTYLESIGVKFGENLNAYTSFDETVYNIDNVKTDRESTLDSCLLILHDWSHDLLLEGKEIDKERGVINEEWRLRSSAMQRMQEKALPEIYPGSKYAERMPIGTMDIVMNFPYKAIRDYYHKWYRPDLQGIVIVGDVDVDKMEQKIKKTFADIPAVKDGAVREYYPVPDNSEPIVSIQKDKEQTSNICILYMKHEAFPRQLRNTMAYYAQNYINDAINGMFSSRIQEILQKENAPFLSADATDADFFIAKTKDAFEGDVVFKDNAYKEGIAALYREILRASRHGFTATEFERYKTEYLSRLENTYAKKDKVYSSQYVNECVRNFLDNNAMPGIEWEYQTMKNMLVPSFSLEMVNQTLHELVPENDSNLVVLMFGPDKEGLNYPTKQEVLDILHAVRAEDIEAYKEEINTDPLIATELKGSKVKKVVDGEFDSKVLTLKNGVKIHVKKTDFSPNSISMSATSWGGTSLYDNSQYLDASNADLVALGGWGNFSATDLQKKLAGIQASADPSVDDRTEGVTGSCVTKDLETMLQLTYLCFTSPRRDDAAVKSMMERSKSALAMAERSPMISLQDTIVKVLYNNNEKARLEIHPTAKDIDAINYDNVLKFYKERFADGDDFEFYFIGDIDLETATPLFEKYLGSLPTKKGSEKYKPSDMLLNKGVMENVFEKELETPNAICVFLYHALMKENLDNVLKVDMLGQLMTALYTETVREDEGGAYTIPVNGVTSDYPEEMGMVQIQLPTAPDKRVKMTEIIYKGIDEMVANGPKAEELQKVKEYMHRSHAENLKKNSYWMSQMINISRQGKNFVDGYDAAVDKITAADIQETARQIFKSGNKLVVGMTSPIKPAENKE
jgi:zinc protease